MIKFTAQVTIANVAVKTDSTYQVETMYTTGKVKKREFQKILDDTMNNIPDDSGNNQNIIKVTCLDVQTIRIEAQGEITDTIDNALMSSLVDSGYEISCFIENPND